ncbi:hypothetical protein [Sediminibacterium soli]|uniref:hypothetical protein n=1 Tax=Sediminibacterium soli TaxID=2698829 RepID=UPI001379983B|nr:hypothetical protein [Sediminibacterium soli]NCI46102.1 hypothetical protein [Sediminibacterium soli]
MPSKKTDTKGFASENMDMQEDIGAKGGPATGLGNPDAAHAISHPYDADLQTQIVAKGRRRKLLPKPAKQPIK